MSETFLLFSLFAVQLVETAITVARLEHWRPCLCLCPNGFEAMSPVLWYVVILLSICSYLAVLFNLIWVDDIIFLIPPSAFFLPNSRITWLLCDFHGSFGVQLRFILGALVVYAGLHGGLRGGENIPNRKLFGWGYFLRPCWCYVGPILGNLGSNLGPDWATWGPTSVHFGRFVGLCRAPWRSPRAKVQPQLGPDHEPYETLFVPDVRITAGRSIPEFRTIAIYIYIYIIYIYIYKYIYI